MRGAGRVLDLGSGKGRFARLVLADQPGRSVVAFDLAVAMLQAADPNLGRCAGSMLQLPFRDQVFDGAFATESLEHAVDVRRAIGELCRVVRPGGRIVIIDKNADHWGKLPTPSWERWFHDRELTRLLEPYCRDIHAAPISYWEDVAPDGMFLCWRATRSA
jgi:ubiquinone/menaquinone biosynthesis C-methylase UbiE